MYNNFGTIQINREKIIIKMFNREVIMLNTIFF